MTTKNQTCDLNVAYGADGPGGLPVSVGVPFPRGMLASPDALEVVSPCGGVLPAAGRALARHADGSVRWGLVSFGARKAGPHRLRPARQPSPQSPVVTLHQTGDNWRIESDRLRVKVMATGPGLLGELVCDGYPWLAQPDDLHFVVDDASTRHEKKRKITVVEATSRRVRLRVDGAHYTADGQPRLNYRLHVEVWAGCPSLRLDYHYFNLHAGVPQLTVRRIALETTWQLGTSPRRHFIQKNHGVFYHSRHVLNPEPVAIVADSDRGAPHVESPEMLCDDVDYPFYLGAPLVNTQDWLGVGDRERSVYIKMQEFLLGRPNRIASAGSDLSAEFWPASAGPLELPQGRSRRQTVVLAFPDSGITGQGETVKLSAAPIQAPKGVAALLDAPLHEGRACVSPDWLAFCNEFQSGRLLPAGRHVRIENNLREFMWLDMPYTKFDVGDTGSHYNSSYASLRPDGVHPLPGAPEIPRIFPGSRPTVTYLDLHEPVWTNNEYDVIHAFANELMRTGRHDLWSTLRLTARHNIEVDFLHYSDHRWLHRATPAHSARHTTTGAYPSHFWTQGLLEYYCLSGDLDALEVALALGDKTLENFADPELRATSWGFNREIGWSVLLLACLVNVTGEPRFRPLLDEMVDYLVSFDRDGFRGGINLSAGNDRQNLNRQIVGNFFGYASMIEGIDVYAGLAGRQDVADWLGRFCLDLADEAMNAAREGQIPGVNFCTALSIGYERTGDKRFMELTSLLLDRLYWRGDGLRGGGTVKTVASSHRNLTRWLKHAWDQGLLTNYEFPALRHRPREAK